VESTSGNFGIALAGICKALKIRFMPVIDPNISGEKEAFLRLSGCDVVKVTEPDETGGFLLTRIKTVKQVLMENDNAYTPNQYENPDNCMAYYYTLGREITAALPRLDYAFISVSTGGTIAGLSNRLKEHYKNITIIAVDVEGSMIFSDKPKTRKISGMGASMRTVQFNKARIDDYMILPQKEIVQGCHELLSEHNLFLGGSSGAAYAAANMVLKKLGKKNINAIFISPDAGSSYMDTIYNNEWRAKNIF
jgi:N-(2-amino-2-carboxyethyl)-L-glutamate synthase